MEAIKNSSECWAYARKSSEAEDRQALSIESQISELDELARRNGVEVSSERILSESKSAKMPFQRPEFERLAKNIEQGIVRYLFAWHPNRLSRNAIDAARLIDFIDRGKLLGIITPTQTFKNTPTDKFMFTLAVGSAKMDNDQKGIDVKRGLRKKNEMGHPAGVSKPGYMNDPHSEKGKKKILQDPERFPLVEQLFQLFLSGKYSVRRLRAHSEDVVGLRTVQRKKEGGKPLKLSQLYRMLKDPFYAGFFYGTDADGNETRYEVSPEVPRMITEEQYWQIQSMLGRKGNIRPSVHTDSFPYKERSKCGCGGTMVAVHQHQLICPQCKTKFAHKNKDACPRCETEIVDMEDGVYIHYIRYSCIKGKACPMKKKSIVEPDIDESVAKYVEGNLAISKALSDWCVKNLDQLAESEKKNDYERRAAWEREFAKKEKESEELVRMRMKGLMDDAEFMKHKDAVEEEKRRIKSILAASGGPDANRIEEVKKAFNLAVDVADVFRDGTFEEKRDALAALGSNLTISDKKVSVINKELIRKLESGLLAARAKNKRFEPRKCEADKDESGVFAAVRPTLLRR